MLQNDDHFLINTGGSTRAVRIGSLKCITALGDYSAIVTGENKFLVRKTMKDWLEILPPRFFIRIHRSTIINIAFIDRIERMINRTYLVYIKNMNKPFIISRRYSSGIRNKFI
ncbi:MAG: LytR/AlgR family response regulator transcription factor [Syntrophothermus sp.]